MSSVVHPSLNSNIEEVANVGALIRATRLRKGYNLLQISNVLRIRCNYLESIENSRFDELPGAIYTTGFIKTYSEYLGLDGEKLVRKLKAEITALTENNKLSFPAVIPEDGMPSGLVVLTGLLIAVLGYFTWYWFSSPYFFVVENLTTIPKMAAVKVETTSTKPPVAAKNPLIERSSAVAAITKFPSQNRQNVERRTEVNAPAQEVSLKATQEGLGSATALKTPRKFSRETISSEPSRRIEEIVLVEPNKVISPSVSRTTALDVPQKHTSTVQQIPKDETAEDQLIIGSANKALTPSGIEEANAPKEITRNVVNDETLTPSRLTKPDPVQAAFDDSAPDTLSKLAERRANPEVATLSVLDEKPREVNKIITPNLHEDVKLDLKNTSRITITAKNTSWIQLHDIGTNRVILSKILKKNESYQIPDRPGLSLMTGNAGALEITVDGEIVPQVGKLGDVRRKILMEVEILKSGQTAVE